MKLFIAIPSHDRKITVETARCLLDEQAAGRIADIDIHIGFVPGCSLITHARNQAVKDFLDSDCDKLIFVDSDIAWELGDILKLAKHQVDVVGGAYRYKEIIEGYPVAWLDKTELWADPDTGLLEVDKLPGGFIAIAREVFTKLKDAHPDRIYEIDGRVFHAFYHCPPGNGEDGTFCRDWRNIGGKVWLEPRLTLTHVDGGTKYAGNIGNWLKNRG